MINYNAEMFEVTRDLLTKTMEIPRVNTLPLPEYGSGRLDYAMNMSIELSPRGRLWASWTGGGDSEKAFIVLAYSDDSGDSWSNPSVVIDPHDASLPCARSTIAGTLWTDPLGRLWLFFSQSLGYFDGRAGDWFTRCDNSDSDQPTWTTPKRIWHGLTLNKPVVLTSGEWILPVSLWTRDKIDQSFRECFHELDNLRMAHIFSSADKGETWSRRGGVEFPYSDFDEHMFVQLNNQKLWMLARTKYKTNSMWESFSSDFGHTWSEANQSPIKHINSRFHIRRLLSGRLLIVKHGSEIETAPESRSHLSAFLSVDDGATWSSSLLLDERDGVSYPDVTQGTSGTIYISYDRNRDTDGEILLSRITEKDIEEGHCISSKSRLGMIVTRSIRSD
jgi:predicted neuraminidase